MRRGRAYRERLAGNRSENLERAIEAFEKALSIWTRERHPEPSAAARAHLDLAYRERFAAWRENRISAGAMPGQSSKVAGVFGRVPLISRFVAIGALLRRLSRPQS
jgi:hypothetical protein